ncbi:MAG: hypothetical protein GY778_03645, partial [bacterium]|nr:hypothetical protein [bacterium]
MLWALLALLLLLALLSLWRGSRHGKLGLLARCLLASLMAHLLLLLLLSFWNVTSSVVRALRGGDRIQIALSPPSSGQALASQIRGQLTEVEVPESQSIEIERAEPTPQMPPAEAQALLTVEQSAPPQPTQFEFTTPSPDAPAPLSPAAEQPKPERIAPVRSLQVSLPVATTPTETSVPEPTIQTLAAEAVATDRPPVAAVSNEAPRVPLEISPLPDSGENRETSSSAASMVDEAQPREAMPAFAQQQPQLATIDQPVTLQVPLPAEVQPIDNAEPTDAIARPAAAAQVQPQDVKVPTSQPAGAMAARAVDPE